MSEIAAGYTFQTYEQWFLRYTKKFLVGSEFDIANVQLKIDHTLRVLEFARQIVRGENSLHGFAELAELAALFHDVGRFPQYARYHTYNDALSVNHAYQGVVTLKRRQVLAELPAAARKLVLGAVALHNRRALPLGLPPDLRDLGCIVRDADKLDIFQVMLAHFQPGVQHNKVVNLELKPDPDSYTEAILQQVLQRRMVNYRKLVWVNDFKLMLCSWIYDLSYDTSRRLAAERGYLEKLLVVLPQGQKFVALRRQLRQDLAGAASQL